MKGFYVPYFGKQPALVSINGHRLLILARDKDVFEDHLEMVGADRIKKVDAGDSSGDEEFVLQRLAERINAGVVIASSDSEFREVIRSLQQQLPWIQ